MSHDLRPDQTVFHLLQAAWFPLWNPVLQEKIRQFDGDVTAHPETVGACTFIACLHGKPIGMASFDPRQHPERGIIGWNCVVPAYQGKGFGTRQILELLRLFRELGFRRAWVTTADEEFFVPAQRTYEACGFVRVRKTEASNIEYEFELKELLNTARQ